MNQPSGGSEPVAAVAVLVRVTGQVQGVAFRAWTIHRAVDLGLRGWVRNRSDGSVEALFAGPADRVATMVEACRGGPPAAHVTGLTHQPALLPAEPGFHRLPTV